MPVVTERDRSELQNGPATLKIWFVTAVTAVNVAIVYQLIPSRLSSTMTTMLGTVPDTAVTANWKMMLFAPANPVNVAPVADAVRVPENSVVDATFWVTDTTASVANTIGALFAAVVAPFELYIT